MEDNNGKNNEPDAFPLDDAMIRLVEEYQRHTMMIRGALNLFCIQQKLVGAWDIAANGREIVRIQQQPSTKAV